MVEYEDITGTDRDSGDDVRLLENSHKPSRDMDALPLRPSPEHNRRETRLLHGLSQALGHRP